jgi:hypothetical protein
MTEKSLQVIEQKEVYFYGDELTAVRASDGQVYVSVTQMCVVLGIDAPTQRRRIQGHEILSEGYERGWLTTPPSEGGRGGGRQQVGMLRVDLVPLWLAGVRLSLVKENIRDKLKRFQREAAKVLWEAFQEGRLSTEPEFEELLTQADPAAVQAYQMFQALTKLARSHILLQARVDQHDQVLTSHSDRLEAIESQLGDPGKYVTPDQASQISQAVKTVALALGKQTKRNEFGAVYGELYRKFGITSYKMLPARRFEEAMRFLTKWHEDASSELPF